MGYWEQRGASDEWYTPAYVFETPMRKGTT